VAVDSDPRALPESHRRNAVDLPDDQDAAGPKASHRQAAARRVPMRRARILHRLRTEVDERPEMQLTGPAERVRSPRRRVAERKPAAPVCHEPRRVSGSLRGSVPAAAGARQRDGRHDPGDAEENAPRAHTAVHTTSV